MPTSSLGALIESSRPTEATPGNESGTIRERSGKNSSVGIDEDGRQRSMSGNVDKNIPDDAPHAANIRGNSTRRPGCFHVVH